MTDQQIHREPDDGMQRVLEQVKQLSEGDQRLLTDALISDRLAKGASRIEELQIRDHRGKIVAVLCHPSRLSVVTSPAEEAIRRQIPDEIILSDTDPETWCVERGVSPERIDRHWRKPRV